MTVNKGLREENMYRIIACDLDETLLKHDKTICEENIRAVKALKDHDIWFVPTTGRAFRTVDPVIRALGLDEPGQYVISYNGGAITDNQDHRLLYHEGIPFDLAEELFQRGKRYDVCMHIYTKEKVYGYNIPQFEIDYLKGRVTLIPILDNTLGFLKGQEIMKIIYMNLDYDYLFSIESEMDDLKDGLTISYSSGRYMEFNHHGVSKGAGLLRLAELLDVKPEETIAIGDNLNDLSMIRMAGFGVGVANTVTDMKKDCDFITRADCNNGAVAEVIARFVVGPLNAAAEA